MANWRWIGGAVLLLGMAAGPVGAITILEPPIVTEQLTGGGWKLEYTIENPTDSTADDIVGFIIDVSAFNPFWTDTANLWKHQSLTASDWSSNMAHEGSPSGSYGLTWQQFFGGMAYPYGATPAAGYFVAYSSAGAGSYQFDTPSLAVSPGETLDQYFANGQALSTFYLAYTGDASTDTFDSSGLPWVTGEAVPEPCSAALLSAGLAAVLWMRKRRRG